MHATFIRAIDLIAMLGRNFFISYDSSTPSNQMALSILRLIDSRQNAIPDRHSTILIRTRSGEIGCRMIDICGSGNLAEARVVT